MEHVEKIPKDLVLRVLRDELEEMHRFFLSEMFDNAPFSEQGPLLTYADILKFRIKIIQERRD